MISNFSPGSADGPGQVCINIHNVLALLACPAFDSFFGQEDIQRIALIVPHKVIVGKHGYMLFETFVDPTSILITKWNSLAELAANLNLLRLVATGRLAPLIYVAPQQCSVVVSDNYPVCCQTALLSITRKSFCTFAWSSDTAKNHRMTLDDSTPCTTNTTSIMLPMPPTPIYAIYT